MYTACTAYRQLGDFNPRRFAVRGNASSGTLSCRDFLGTIFILIHFWCFLNFHEGKSYFHKFYLRPFKAEKGLEFLMFTILEKIVRQRVKFFEPVPQLALLQLALSWIGISSNWHFPQLEIFAIFCGIENLSPPTTGTPPVRQIHSLSL